MVMLISYHIKAELCTLFDKVHKAFINSTNAPLYFLPSADDKASAVPAACRRRREMAADGQAGHGRRPAAGGLPGSPGGDKRGQGHRMVPLPPLDSPKPSFALTHRRCAAKRGLRGLGSVRRAAFGTHYCPEFTLREPPRITVRGQTVQGA